MVAENGSARVTECDCSISSPLRMCHPILASLSRRGARIPPLMATSRMMKIRSLTEGKRNRNHTGCLDVLALTGTCYPMPHLNVGASVRSCRPSRALKSEIGSEMKEQQLPLTCYFPGRPASTASLSNSLSTGECFRFDRNHLWKDSM